MIAVSFAPLRVRFDKYPRRPRRQSFARTLGVFIALPLLTTPLIAHAQTYTYTGSGGTASAPVNGFFSNGFSPSLFSGSSFGDSPIVDTLAFGGASYSATDDLTAPIYFFNLRFTNTGAVTLARGTNANASNILLFLQSASPGQTVVDTITLNNTGTLLVALNMVLEAPTQVGGAGSATFSGTISTNGASSPFTKGNSDFIKAGTGTLTLTGRSSITGTLQASGGILNITSANNASPASFTSTLLMVGRNGSGVLNILGGGTVRANNTYVGFIGGEGTLTVGGTSAGGVASSLVTTTLDVGTRSSGTLLITDGGSVTSSIGTDIGSSVTASNGGVNGQVTVRGTSAAGVASQLNTNQLTVGDINGSGILNISEGGRVSAGETTLGSFYDTASGYVTVSGKSSGGITSQLTTNGNRLIVGADGQGTLNILNGAQVTAGEVVLAQESGSVATLTINGGSLTADTLRVGSGVVSSFVITNPMAANGGGYALNLGGANGSSTINTLIEDASPGNGGSPDGSISGGPGGAGGIRKTGTGTLTLGNINNSFSGGVAIEGGAVSVGANSNLGTGTVVLNGGLLRWTGPTQTLGRTVSLGSAATGSGFDIATTSTNLTVGSLLSGSGGLIKTGAGTLTLTNIGSSFSGNLNINAGTLVAAGSQITESPGASVLGSPSVSGRTITVGDGVNAATLNFGTNRVFGTGNSNPAVGITINAGGTVTNSGAQFNILPSLVLNGGTLTGTGGVSQSEQMYGFAYGSVTVGGTSQSTISGSGPNSGYHLGGNTLFNVADATASPSTDLLVSGTLVDNFDGNGPGSLTKTGSGTMTLSNANNSFSGDLQINGGTVIASGSNTGVSNPTTSALGSVNTARTVTVGNGGTLTFAANDVLGTVAGTAPTLNLVVNAGGTVNNSGPVFNVLGPVSLNGGTLTAAGGANAQSLSYALRGGVTVGGTTASIISGSGSNSGYNLQASTAFNVANVTGNAAADLVVSGTLANQAGGAGNGGVAKTGSGTMLIIGANTYAGGTIISAGTVAASGTGLGTGPVSVRNGGQLSVGAVINTSTASQAVNSLTISSLSIAANSTFPQLTFNLGASGVSDSLIITGTGSSAFASSGAFSFGFASATGASLDMGTYTLITFAGQTNTASLPSLSTYSARATGNLSSLNTSPNAFQYVINGQGQETLVFSLNGAASTPEPSSLALLLWAVASALPAGAAYQRLRLPAKKNHSPKNGG